MNTDSDITKSESQIQTMNILTMHSSITGLEAGITRMGEVYLPSTFEFFSPIASQQFLTNAFVSNTSHIDSVSVRVGGANQLGAFRSISNVGNVPHSLAQQTLTFYQPRANSQNMIDKLDPSWDKYVERMDVLARYPIDFAAPKMAMLRPLVSASTQWRIPPLLPYMNTMSWLNSDVGHPQIQPGNYHVESLNSLADILSQPATRRLVNLKNLRCFDGSILKRIMGLEPWADLSQGPVIAILSLMFNDFGLLNPDIHGYTLVDTSVAEKYTILVGPAYDIAGIDFDRTYQYMNNAHSLDDNLLGLYLYPRYNSPLLYYRNQANDNNDAPQNVVVTRPSYDFMDHYVALVHQSADTRHDGIGISNVLITIKCLAKQIAKYMAGHSLLPSRNFEGYRDIQMDLTVRYGYLAYVNTYNLDFFPFELIYIFGGTMKDFQRFVCFSSQASGDLPVERFEMTWRSNAIGTGSEQLRFLPQGNAKNTILGVKATFTENAALLQFHNNGIDVPYTSRYGGAIRATRFSPTAFNLDTSLNFTAIGKLGLEQDIQWFFTRNPVAFGNRSVVSSYNPLA